MEISVDGGGEDGRGGGGDGGEKGEWGLRNEWWNDWKWGEWY